MNSVSRWGECILVYISSANIPTLIKKKKKIFLRDEEIQMGSGAKSFMREGFLIYKEMRKYLVTYKEAVSHI